MLFRPAMDSDVPALEKLVNSAYRGDFAKTGWTTEADLLGGQRTDQAALRELIKCPNSFILLLCDPELVGCVNLKKMEVVFYLGMLTVRPDLQDRSYGKALLKAGESFVKERQGQFIEMQVISLRQELIAWYLRQGYVQTGERRPFPAADPRFGIPKSENLEFVVLKKEL